MSLFERVGMAALRQMDPERAHGLALTALRLGAAPGRRPAHRLKLATRVWDLNFPNILGVAAGFDKNAAAPDAMLARGFGFVEVGAVTPRPQPGNPRPRLFRLPEDQAVINRFGFNNDGLDAMVARLAARKAARRGGIVGVNLGANKDSVDRAADYVGGVTTLAGFVDFFTVNVSSPNTVGLRDLQAADALTNLLKKVVEARDYMGVSTPILVKIAPDLDEAGLEATAEAALSAQVDGMIATNTTLDRTGLTSMHRDQAGGLSGAPLAARSTEALRRLAKALNGAMPLIGVGGVASGADAYAKIRAGASLVQVYTALVYHGPSLGAQILDELEVLLTRDGFANAADAIGADL